MPAQSGIPAWLLHRQRHWNRFRKGPWILYFRIKIINYHWSPPNIFPPMTHKGDSGPLTQDPLVKVWRLNHSSTALLM